MNDGIHIRAIIKHNPADPEGPRIMELQIGFLPNDQELLQSLYTVARNAVSAELVRRGLTSGEAVELPTGGDVSRKH